jgi:predicted transcriptional regulator
MVDPKPITDADKLRAALTQLDLSQRGAAKLLGLSERMMRYYCAGTEPVPLMVFLAIERLLDVKECPYCQESRMPYS